MLNIKGDPPRCRCPGCSIPTVPYHDGITEEEALCERCYARMVLNDKSDDELKQMVKEAKASEAHFININGRHGQLDYLVNEYGWRDD